MHRLLIILWIGVINFMMLKGQSHEGTEFWFGFMEHRDVGENTMIAMITSKYNTSGKISFPLSTWELSFTIQANQVRIIQLPRGAETLGSENITRNGLQITTEHPSSVYIHQYFGLRSEATALLPINSTGSEYFVMSYTGINNNGIDYFSEFLIVAQEESTLLEITPSTVTQKRKSANESFTVTLDAGETYQVKAAASDSDLTGTHIKGNKDFAVFGGNEWTQVPTQCALRDNLLEQMYPVNTWGKQFVSFPFANNPRDVYRVLASEDNTLITIEHGTQIDTFIRNRGEFVEIFLSEAACFKGNKPILVAQYIIGVQCTNYPIGDPSMVLLNSVEQTRDTLTFYSSRFQAIEENYVNIVVQSKDIANVSLDGQSLLGRGASYRTIGTNPEFAYVTLQIPSGSHTLASTGCGISAIAYGYGEAESYAYSGGANFNNINPQPLQQMACASDTFLLDPKLSPNRYSFNWDLGDGTVKTSPTVKHAYKAPGSYQVTLSVRDDCLNQSLEVVQELVVAPLDTLEAGPDQILCEGESFSLEAGQKENAIYSWRGPMNFQSSELLPQLDSAVPSMTGEYFISAIIDNCPAVIDTTQITIIPTPQPELGMDTFFCPDKGDRIILDPGSFTGYEWEDQTTLSSKEILQGGRYDIWVMDEWGCIGTDTILIDERCPALLSMPNVFSPNGDQINDVFAPMGEYILELQMKVYDRWGKQIFETQEIAGNWNGEDTNGNQSPEGVYFWQLEWEGFTQTGERFRQQQQGTVWLVR